MFWTNRGSFLILDWIFHRQAMPTNLYVALVTADIEPTVKINTFGQLTEIADGNGYTTGGYQITPDATDFDVMTQDDVNDLALTQIKDIAWTATGGPIPASGDGARYAVLLDDNGTIANRQVIAVWDMITDRAVTVGNPLTLIDLELKTVQPT